MMSKKDLRRRSAGASPRDPLKKQESAVSPVVGVMLMLIVTIIIAAVVSSFASGLGTSAQTGPVAAFDVKISAAGEGTHETTQSATKITLLSGDAIDSGDIQIITSYVVPETYNGQPVSYAGRMITHTIDGRISGSGFDTGYWNETGDATPAEAFEPNRVHAYYPTGQGAEFTILETNVNAMYGETGFFGDAIFKPGETKWFKQVNCLLGFDTTNRMAYGFQEGSRVHVTILHLPTNTILYDKDVVVEWY